MLPAGLGFLDAANGPPRRAGAHRADPWANHGSSDADLALLAAILLAVFVLPEPGGLVAVAGGFVFEIGEAALRWRLSRRRRPEVGVEALVGSMARTVTDCRPRGHVRVAGELWQARCDAGAEAGEDVLVLSVEGLTLVVARHAT